MKPLEKRGLKKAPIENDLTGVKCASFASPYRAVVDYRAEGRIPVALLE